MGKVQGRGKAWAVARPSADNQRRLRRSRRHNLGASPTQSTRRRGMTGILGVRAWDRSQVVRTARTF
jgi:hypothetical protein